MLKEYELFIDYGTEIDSYYKRLTGEYWTTNVSTSVEALREMREVDPETFADLDGNDRTYWVFEVRSI